MQTVVIVVHLMIVAGHDRPRTAADAPKAAASAWAAAAAFMSNRGTTNVLTRATAVLAAVFFVTSLMLSILAGFDRKPTSDPGDKRAIRAGFAGHTGATRSGRGRPARSAARRRPTTGHTRRAAGRHHPIGTASPALAMTTGAG